MPRSRKRKPRSLISAHLTDIRRGLLEGERRPAFLAFLGSLPTRRGIYTLYDKKRRLYYAGKASDLPRRLNQHLKGRHGEGWELMTLFIANTVSVNQLEALLVAAAHPPGNKQHPKLGQDLRGDLRRYLRRDSLRQIDDIVFPGKGSSPDPLARRITAKKLRRVSQDSLARVLGISQPRVSQLVRKNKIRQYIREAGKRDAVLLLLQKAKR